MRKWRIAISVIAFAIVGAFATQGAFAKEISLGNHSAEEISGLCHAHGGEFLGVSDSGAYGCEYKDSDTLILCNKSGNCTGYTAAKTRAQGQRILDIAGIKGKAVVVKSGSGKPGTPKAGNKDTGGKQ